MHLPAGTIYGLGAYVCMYSFSEGTDKLLSAHTAHKHGRPVLCPALALTLTESGSKRWLHDS